MYDERNEWDERDLNEEEREEMEPDNWKEGKTLSGEGTLPSVISLIAVLIAAIAVIATIALNTKYDKVQRECTEANLAIAELREQNSKPSQTPADSDKIATVDEDVITELQESVAEVKDMASENRDAISELEKSLPTSDETSSDTKENYSELQKEVEGIQDKLSEHDTSISALQGKSSGVDTSKYDIAISDIQTDISKTNGRIDNAEKRIAEVEKKTQSTSGSSGSSSNTDKKDDKKEEDSENKYNKGTDCVYFFNAREKVKAAYNSDQITRKQLEKYVDSYLTIYNKAIRDQEITAEDVNRHNSILKDMPTIDYDWYHIKSAGSEYRKGLKDKIRYNAYRTATEYYYKSGKIPEDEYNEYDKKAEKNKNSTSENEIRDTVDLARRLINRYIKNPDEVITWDEWRGVTSVDTFLDYID